MQTGIVDHFGPNFTVSNFRSYRLAPMRLLCRSLYLLFFGALLAVPASAIDRPSARPPSLEPSLSFSLGDFDGDSKPDLASVQYGTSDSARAAYRIQLQLSAAASQSFQIAAPIGGLQIVSRDVNGDNALDLVLTTTWLRQPVAILLNDGHGSFTRVDPDVFPEAFRASGTNWSSTTENLTDALGIPPQSREAFSSKVEFFLHLSSPSGFVAFPELQLAPASFSLSHSPRAPPFEFPQL